MDIMWLQRDLGLYVVGLFDTFHASSLLGYPKRSLAALLLRHANFDAAKQYQMADWRTRFANFLLVGECLLTRTLQAATSRNV